MGDELREPDLVLLVGKIEEDARRTSYSIAANRESSRNLNARTLGSGIGTYSIMGTDRYNYDDLLGALKDPVKTRATDSDQEARTDAVRKLGKYLWDLLPDEFKDYYWQHLHGEDLSILVLTDDLLFPWELVWPHRASRAEEWHHIFGVAFSMARWPRELKRLPGPIASAGEFLMAIPREFDHCGQAEYDYLTANYGATDIEPPTFAEIKSHIARTPVRVLHIRAHGVFESGDHAIYLHEGEPFNRLQVPELMRENLAASLVFLNVCQAALRRGPEQQPVQLVGTRTFGSIAIEMSQRGS